MTREGEEINKTPRLRVSRSQSDPSPSNSLTTSQRKTPTSPTAAGTPCADSAAPTPPTRSSASPEEPAMTQPLPPAELTDRYRAELGAAGDLIAVVRGAAGQLDRALSGRLPSLPDIRAAVERIERALAAWDAQPDGATVEQHQTRAIVEAAKYEYGARYCMEGDCDHAAEADDNAPDGAPCPLIETRYATAAQILAVDLLLTSNDGEPLDDAEEIPVGEIRRALGEARTAEVKP